MSSEEKFGIIRLSEAELRHINRGWHRLRPWPDFVLGLTRLKQHFIIAPLSNGNVSLLVNMAKYTGLPWDTIFGSDRFIISSRTGRPILAPASCLILSLSRSCFARHIIMTCGWPDPMD